MTLVLLLPLLAACSNKGGPTYTDYEVGRATACLDKMDAAISAQETEVYDITGTVYADEPDDLAGNLHPCGEHSRVLTILGDDGGIYGVGYGLWDEDGIDITPSLDLMAGDDVYLHFVSIESFGEAAGFVVQDTDSVAFAIEVGTWGPALERGVFPGLEVGTGELVGSGRTDCGDTEAREILFAGDAERAITPMDDALITVGGEAYRAWALSAWDYTLAECTDVAGELVWAVFR